MSGTVHGCPSGVHGQAAAGIEVMRSRFEPWGSVGGMSADGCEELGWDAGQHDLAQDEWKGAQAGSE